MFILTLLVLEFFALRTWSVCKNLHVNLFHFTKSQYDLQLIGLTTNKIDSSIPEIRFFHNKISVFVQSVFDLLIRYWDALFIVNLISLAGLIFSIFGIYSLLEKKHYRTFFLVITLGLFIQLIEIFKSPPVPFSVKVLLLSLPFVIFSVIGIRNLKISRSHFPILLLLTLASVLWFLVFQNQAILYCVKI